MYGLTFTDIDFFIDIFYQTLKNSMLRLVVCEMRRRVDDLRSPVHRDQLRAQRSVSSMGKPLPFLFCIL